MQKGLIVKDLGSIDYQTAWDLQTHVHRQLIDQKRLAIPEFNTPNTLFFCEHPHVYTLGKSGQEGNLKISQSELNDIQATFYKINRGGDITYHGPGQLVIYPIIDLDQLNKRDVHWFVRMLEEVIIKCLNEYNVKGERIKEYTGVWVGSDSLNPRKICALGIHLSRWVSLHGLAFNINPDLSYFQHIIPCGIKEGHFGVTSLQNEVHKSVEMNKIKESIVKHFLEIFELIEIKVNENTE